ncbi:MAG: hypothetical protein J0L83_10010 [Chitinophagales bacterium]|nr:hypothetical protein [Chitinophagales bacterium]
MKTLLKYLILLSFAASCNPSFRNNYSIDSKQIKRVRIHEGFICTNFKNEVFIQCLRKIYAKELVTLDSLDGSTAANKEHLGYDAQTLHLIDSLASVFSKRPEMNWHIENKRVIINLCLEYRNSKDVDQIALRIAKDLRKKYM